MYDDEDTVDELPAPPRKDIPEADRELLELAARALGARFEEVDGEGYGNLHFADGSVVHAWNSLEFSGDSFDLLVRLRLTLEVFDDRVVAKTYRAVRGEMKFVLADERPGDNPAGATRRAVTRAAAEIGKAT